METEIQHAINSIVQKNIGEPIEEKDFFDSAQKNEL